MKVFVIELSDLNFALVTEEELQKAKGSAEEFDGFLGFTVIKEIDMDALVEQRIFKIKL